jgi:hypothetical protein
MEYKRGINLSDYYDRVVLTPNETIFVSPNKRVRMQQDIEDATQPWGALAVLKEVEVQCSYMPVSTLSVGRTAFVIVPAIMMAFTVNDVLNNTRAKIKYWPSILLICLALALEMLTIAYNRYYDTLNKRENHQESLSQTKDEKEHEEEKESRLTIELREISKVQELEIGMRASDIDRDSSLPDQGLKSFPEVCSDNNEQGRKEEAASPMHAECLDSEL